MLPLLTPCVAGLLLSPLLGLDPKEGAHLPLRSLGAGNRATDAEKHDQVVTFVMTLLAWARKRWLHSPYVLEVLLITLLAWSTEQARTSPVESAAVSDHHEENTAGPWGLWIDVLTSAPEEAQVGSLLQIAAGLPHWQAAWTPAAPVNMALRPWAPEVETKAEAEERLRREFEKTLARHLAEMRAAAEEAGLEPSPVKTAGRHFEWMALRQVAGWRPSRIAERFGVGASTVRAALADLSKLLELQLRPVKPGPEPW